MQKISHDSETPAEGQQVITACAFIHHNFDGVEKVFLPKRAKTKKFLPDVYELPGGHIDYGEELVAGLQREIQEEFSVSSNIGDPFFAFTYMNEVKGSHSLEIVYFAQLDDITAIQLHPEDHSESGWFAEDELEDAYSANKGVGDIEFTAMRKGFAILRGKALTT